MGTYDRRSFLKQTAMLAATAAAGGGVLAYGAEGGGAGSAAGQQPAARPFFAKAASPDVIAHRGGDGQWPGETLYAFEQALAAGAHVIEMDVHMTCDGVLVLMHNNTVNATTEGKGCIVNKAWKGDLEKLDAAHDWKPGRHARPGDRHPGRQGVPRLEDVFAKYAGGDVRMNIEIKQAAPAIVRPVWEMIQKYNMQDRVLVASFDTPTVQAFRRESKGAVATSASTCELSRVRRGEGKLTSILEGTCGVFLKERQKAMDVRCRVGQLFADTPAACKTPALAAPLPAAPAPGAPDPALEFEAVQVPFDKVGNLKDFVAGVRQRHPGLKVHVWTVNKPKDMEKVLDAGVDGVITDYPGVLLDILRKRP